MNGRYQILPTAGGLFRWSLLPFVVLAGCWGGDDGPKRGEVSGVVTLDGEPVKGAILEFIPEAQDGTTSYGGTDEDGHYTMLFGSSRTGAVLGRNLVRITTDDRSSVGGEDYEFTELFPPKYNVRSDIYVDVQAGENEFNFACESEGMTPRKRRTGGGS
jgi:hypothetical protein